MPNPPRTSEECFSTILLWLSLAVDARGFQGRLAVPLVVLIMNRIREIGQRFARLAARIRDGRYVPRRAASRPHIAKKLRRPNPLPQGAAWLLKLVPEAVGFGSQLEHLFRDPDMAALLATAPASMRRPLRSLCRMLGVQPPPILALPAPARRQAPSPPAPAAEPGESRPAPQRMIRSPRPRYVFGLRWPPPLPNPA